MTIRFVSADKPFSLPWTGLPTVKPSPSAPAPARDTLELSRPTAPATVRPLRTSFGSLQALLRTRLATYGAQQPTPSVGTASFRSALSQAKAGQPLALGTGTYALKDFGNDLFGVNMPASVTGIAGQGIDRTFIEMTPHTSTHAKDVPTKDWATNQLSLLQVSGSPNLHDFTLRATEQGHLYNGLRISHTTHARVTNVKVTGVPGNQDIPPGETFGINDFHGQGSVYKNVEVDGMGVGASGFATNSSSDITVDHGYFHGSGVAHGATFWQTRNVTITDTTSVDNKDCGFNFERVSGTVNIVRPVMRNNKLADIRVVSDQASAKVTIVDPVFTGPKLRIKLSKTYMGKPSAQRKEDIRVIIHGVDRTNDVVQWIGG